MPKKQKEEGVSKTRMALVYFLIIGAILIVSISLQAIFAIETPLQRCNSLVSQQGRFSCMLGLALATKNLSICILLPSSYSSICLLKLSENSTNASLCSRIENITYKEECINYVASATGNLSYCAEESEPYIATQ